MYCDLLLLNSSIFMTLIQVVHAVELLCFGAVEEIVNIFVDHFIENCAFFLKLSLFLVESAIDYLLGLLACLLI